MRCASKRWAKAGEKMEKFLLPMPVERCCTVLRGVGYAAHPVGGCVRDLLLGRVPGDWDVTTSAHPEQVQKLFVLDKNNMASPESAESE